MPYLITKSFWKAFPPGSLLVLSSHRGLYSRLAHWSIQGQGARVSAGHHRCSGGKAGKNSSKKWASLDIKQEIQVQKNYPELLRKGGGWLSMIHLPGTNCPWITGSRFAFQSSSLPLPQLTEHWVSDMKTENLCVAKPPIHWGLQGQAAWAAFLRCHQEQKLSHAKEEPN